MKKLFAVLISVVVGMAANAQDTKNYKNQKIGFEFSYPNSWKLESEMESEDGNSTVPLKDSPAIVAYMNNENKEHCALDRRCLLAITIVGNGTEDEYKKAIEHVNKFQLYENTPLAPKRRLQVETLGGNTLNLLVRERDKDSFQGKAYIYCKVSKYLATFSTNVDRKNRGELITNNNLKISLETLFIPEQQLIIKSFKCLPKK